ncbi:hypothetical protein TVAG_069590 [Trichomonas vaginalis G3]|uniref:Uncharacterized protein n=1 Tax=Trichomonas vaginalis (strain ATCC PRA-98 / G3) TaxID=412133 RepID=A2ELB2_TRIV3|nr:hypothetical protein TVAGG3_0003660 [Trichomonas vaginalis G3]EAY06589.1 hypothetical protein TVAG_069590 [Trichomonas vaginalis G3]KAI5538776.1 hypothetical protein TVAGG3_0003660 [Trichomonas vaginalis G3]|eukprot:XP_001318812.1 hypothetical protein [Trichomonas vaginalis G3]
MNNEHSHDGKVKVRVRVQRRKYDSNGNEIPHNHQHSSTKDSNNSTTTNQTTNTLTSQTLVPATTNDLTTLNLNTQNQLPEKQSNVRLTRRRKKVNTVGKKKHFEEIDEDGNFTEIDENTYEPALIRYNSRFVGKGPFDSTTYTESTIETGAEQTMETEVEKTAVPRTTQSFTSFVGTALAHESRTGEEEDSEAEVQKYVPRDFDTFGLAEDRDLSYLYPKPEQKKPNAEWLKKEQPAKLNQFSAKDDLEVIEFEPFFQKEKKFSRKTFKFDNRPQDESESLSSIVNTFNDELDSNTDTTPPPDLPKDKYIIESIENEDQLIEIYQTGSDSMEIQNKDNQNPEKSSVKEEKVQNESESLNQSENGSKKTSKSSASINNAPQGSVKSSSSKSNSSKTDNSSISAKPTAERSIKSHQSSSKAENLSTSSRKYSDLRSIKSSASRQRSDRESYTGSIKPLPPTDPNNPNFVEEDIEILPINTNTITEQKSEPQTASKSYTDEYTTVSELQTATSGTAEYALFTGPSGIQPGVDYYVELSIPESSHTHDTSQSGVELAEDDDSSKFSDLKEIEDVSERDDY